MDQFNRDTYKRDTVFQEFYHSCMGKLIILGVILFILFIIGIMTGRGLRQHPPVPAGQLQPE